jgi:hypothetical protein
MAWPFASIRGDAETRSLSKRSGHSASRAYDLDCENAPCRQHPPARDTAALRVQGRKARQAGRLGAGANPRPPSRASTPAKPRLRVRPCVRRGRGLPRHPPPAIRSHGRRSALACFGTGKSPYLEQKWNKVMSTKLLVQHALALKWCQIIPNGALRT